MISKSPETERNIAEQKLRESEERFAKAFHASPLGQCIARKEDGCLLEVNDEFCRWLGFDRNDLVNHTTAELNLWVDPDGRGRMIQLLEREGHVRDFELLCRHSSGDIRVALVSAEHISVSGEKCILELWQDVTERRRTEDLQRCQYDLSRLLSATSDLDTILRVCTEAAINASHLDCGGIYLVEPETGDLVLFYHTGLGREFASCHARVVSTDQRTRLVSEGKAIYYNHEALAETRIAVNDAEGIRSLAVFPILQEQQLIGCLNIGSHILDEIPVDIRMPLETIAGTFGRAIIRSRARQALEVSRANLKAVLETTHDLIILKDRDCVYRLVNRAFCSFLGRPEEDVIGKTDHDLFAHEAAARYREDDEGVMTTGIPLCQDEQVLRPDSCKWMNTMKTPFRDKSGNITGVLLTVRDITERKRMEEEIKLHRDHLDELVKDRTAELVSANERLTSEISHRRQAEVELRLFRQLLDQSTDAIHVIDRDSGKYLDANDTACERLGYSRDEFMNMTVFDVNQGLDDLAAWREITSSVDATGRLVTESTHLRKNGLSFPVEVSLKAVELDGSKYIVSVARDITERKRSEESLRTSEEQYRSITETIQDVVYRLDREGYVTYVSPSMEETLGFPRSEVVGAHFTRLIHADDLQKANENYLSLLSGNRLVRSNLRILTAGGGHIHSEVSAVPLVRDGTVMEIQAAVHDITEHIRVEETLRESEGRFRRLLDDAPIAISMVNDDRVVVYVNRKHADIMGYEQRDIPTLEHWWSQAYPDDAHRQDITERWNAMIERAKRGEKIGPVDRRVRCKDGTIKDLELRFTRSEGRTIVAFADITERKRTEEAIRKNRELLDEAQRVAHIGSWELTIATGEIMGTDEAHRIFGVETGSGRIPISAWTERIHPDDRVMVLDHYQETVATGIFNELTYRLVRPDGAIRHVCVTGRVVRDDTGIPLCMIGMFQDITEQRRLEQAVLDIEDRERRRIGQDVHDGLGQILAASAFICSSLGRSLDGKHPESALQVLELSGLIHTAKDQSRSIIRGIVAVEMGKENLVIALQRLAEESSRYFNRSCEFECRGPISITDHGAAVHLYRIAQEAMTNALRHAGADRILLKIARRGKQVLLTVADDGCGYDTGSDQGMGLRIMHYRARLINARLTADSRRGSGTTISCAYEEA